MGLFIILIIIVAVVEGLLGAEWNAAYFKSGIPVYRKICQGPIISSPVINDQKIESLVQDKNYAEVQFRNARDNFFIFQETSSSQTSWRKPWENYRFIAVMRGNLTIDPKTGQVKVVGRLDWYILLVVVLIIKLIFSGFTQEDPIKLFFLLGVLVMGLIYFYQANRFGQIADRVAKNLKELESADLKTEEMK